MSREDEAAIANWTAGGRAPNTSGPSPRESLKVGLGVRGIGATNGTFDEPVATDWASQYACHRNDSSRATNEVHTR